MLIRCSPVDLDRTIRVANDAACAGDRTKGARVLLGVHLKRFGLRLGRFACG